MSTASSLTDSINSIVNQSDVVGVPSRVVQAIKNAAARTGVDFSYLLKKAAQESGFDAAAKAVGSSASGLYQFTGQTWLGMVKAHGADYGLGDYAAKITADANGHLHVSDTDTKKQILSLRSDPQISALMAGELDKQNAGCLKSTVGGKIGGTELYLAHFLGAGGACDFISEMRDNPTTAGADVLPAAAAANPTIFYGKDGQPRSLQQIYQHFATKFDSASPLAPVTTAVASAATSSAISPPVSVEGVASMDNSGGALSVGGAVGGATTAQGSGFHLASTAIKGVDLSGASTLFAAMILGQMQGSGSSTGLDAVNQADNKKKDALSILSFAA